MQSARVRMGRHSVWVLAAAVLFLAAACASVDLAPPDQDAKAKAMEPPPGKALVYVYRSEALGSAVKMNVMVNGKLLGQTAAHTYFLVATPPGKVTVTSLAEDTSELELQVSAGQKYFVWEEVKMGAWSARSALSQKGAPEGMNGVQQCKLIKYVEL
jgi:Protein of unknown function (DUF2846)